MYLIDKSDYVITEILTNASKEELFVSSETASSEWSAVVHTMTRGFKNSEYNQEIP